MSLHSFLHTAAPARPARITIRRRLLGRGSRLRSTSIAAALLSLGLASFQPAHAGTSAGSIPGPITWNGLPGDWFAPSSHWSNGSTPTATDDALNSYSTAAMTLGQSTTVNSFFSNGAFTLNGGTFSGNKANAASLLTVNNVFTLNGGTISNFTVNAGTKQGNGPAPSSVVVTSNGGNDFVNSVVNANLDLVTNANAFLRFQGTDTVNGTISLGTTSNGLNIYTTNDNLIIGGSGKLIGFGNISESGSGSILTNNGLINATGGALTQNNSNFVNSGTAEATAGGTLALSSTLTNTGKLVADGAGSTLTLVGTLASGVGSTISATNGGKVLINGVALSGPLNGVGATSLIFNASGSNDLISSVANINLDLATNANAFLRFQGTDTVNGTISLGTTSNGLNIYTSGDNLIIGGSGKLIGFGNISESGSGSILTNNGLINATGGALTQNNSNFVNSGTAEATAGGTLALSSTLTNTGKLVADGAGSTLTLVGTLASGVGSTISATNGGQVLVNGVALSGPLTGVGATSLIFNASGGNDLISSVANINLDLATNANAFLRFQGTDTVNGTISLGTTSNGLNIYTSGDNLIIGGSSKLVGFGNIFESGTGSILTNNGLINATGGALTQTNSNFVNSGTAEATAGGTLALNNNITNNGTLAAVGGSLLTVTGTLTSNVGNMINGVGGTVDINGVLLQGTINGVGATSLIFNNNGGNDLISSVANINLDLATNANAFLRFQGTDTVNGTISLGTTSNGLNIYTSGDKLVLNGGLTGFGNVFESGTGSILTNNNTINANAKGKALTQTNSNFVNSGLAEATNGATLALNNNITNNAGATVAAVGAGSLVTLAGTFTGTGNNLITTSGGGQVQVNGVVLRGIINTDAGTSLIVNNSGSNNLTNTTVNGNLSLTNNSFLQFQGMDTVNGTISLGTTSNGLNIYTSGDNLIIGGSSKLVGFGNIFESGTGSILTNNGLINATGGALTQTNSNFVNSGLAEATNGATLALNNNITNNAGATVAAVGAGSLVTLAGTFTGTGNNLITASGGGQVQVNGVALRGIINTDAGTSLIVNNSGSNNLTNTTVNGNLDLATNANAFLQFQGTDTVNGTISLGTTSNGLNIYTSGDNLIIGGSGKLIGFGNVFESGTGSILTNNGLVNANVSGKTLNIANSNFNNTGTAQVTNGAILNVTSTNATNSGVVNVQGGGTANFSGLTQTAGLTQVDGVLNLVNAPLALKGGVLDGSGTINGNVVNTNGIVSPGDSPGTLTINGNYTQGSTGTLNIEFTNSLHDLLNISGIATTGGTLDVNYIDTSAFIGSVGSQFAFLDYGTLAAGTGTNFGFTVTGHNGFAYTVVNDASNKMLDLRVAMIGSPAPAVPEASTTVSLGLLLLLGLGGTVVAAKRKKSIRA